MKGEQGCANGPLLIVIKDHGERVKVIEMDDPRDAFVREFNADRTAKALGLTATIPLTEQLA